MNGNFRLFISQGCIVEENDLQSGNRAEEGRGKPDIEYTSHNILGRAEPSTKFCRVPSIPGRFRRVPSTDIGYLKKCKYFYLY